MTRKYLWEICENKKSNANLYYKCLYFIHLSRHIVRSRWFNVCSRFHSTRVKTTDIQYFGWLCTFVLSSCVSHETGEIYRQYWPLTFVECKSEQRCGWRMWSKLTRDTGDDERRHSLTEKYSKNTAPTQSRTVHTPPCSDSVYPQRIRDDLCACPDRKRQFYCGGTNLRTHASAVWHNSTEVPRS